MPTKERFQARPSGGEPSSTVLCCEISRFVVDSSRSYAKLIFCYFYLIQYFPNAAERIPFATARQACCDGMAVFARHSALGGLGVLAVVHALCALCLVPSLATSC